jgi:hypothetical protein
LNVERLSHDFLGVESATEYFDSEVGAFENACAPSGRESTQRSATATTVRRRFVKLVIAQSP